MPLARTGISNAAYQLADAVSKQVDGSVDRVDAGVVRVSDRVSREVEGVVSPCFRQVRRKNTPRWQSN